MEISNNNRDISYNSRITTNPSDNFYAPSRSISPTYISSKLSGA